MKAPITVCLVLFLEACTSTSHNGTIIDAPMAKDATGQMLSVLPSQQVATCIATAYRSTVQIIEGGYAVRGGERDASYRIFSFADPLNRYQTRVDIIGEPKNENGAGRCIG